MDFRYPFVLLLGLVVSLAQCNIRAPIFNTGENLSFNECGVRDENTNRTSWLAFLQSRNVNCYGIVISRRTILTRQCSLRKRDVENMIARVGHCSERDPGGDCILKDIKIEELVEIRVLDPTGGTGDRILLQLFISKKMPENIRPICLFNRGQEMDMANLADSPYLKMRRITEFNHRGHISDWRDELEPRKIVPHDICFKNQSTEWEQRFGNLLQQSQRFLCVNDPDHLHEGILVNFHIGRYFLRGLSVFFKNESVDFSLYLDILPQIDWIGQHAKGIFVLPAIPPSKPCRGFKNPNNLSVRDCGKKLIIRKTRDADYSEDEEDDVVVNATQHIYFGYKVRRGHPWHAYVENTETRGLCGGTLISMRTVLTAAHCIYGQKANQLRAYIGLYDKRLRNDPTVQKRRASQIICHPGYRDGQLKHDIGLMIFNNSFNRSQKVSPICLWNEDSSLSLVAKRLGVVVGYGLKENDNLPKKLQEAKLPIRSHEECYKQNRKFFGKYLYPGDNFCAGYSNRTTTCKGDSGGGLAVEKDGLWFVRGIVSFGITKKVLVDDEEESFCMPNRYSLFVDVASYMDWIVENTPDVSFKD
ncbi:uncharacterized protein LOC135936256 [Cloeon dipterum]|uniref:uncharacterized protein LOC135936256 n=1 Tax=Cloeon dipterum TaxID=197152 RepID=UPI0032206220